MKLSKAEKIRRKEAKIYREYDYILSELLKCYKMNDHIELRIWYERLIYFVKGCYLADGYKWHKRLNDRFRKWHDENQEIINIYFG